MGLGYTDTGWPWKPLSRLVSGLVAPETTALAEHIVMDSLGDYEIVNDRA